MEQALGDWAIAYAKSLNWFIFPLAPRGKTPITPNGFKDASNDPARIQEWWKWEPQANIGVDCGRSELAVVDLDGQAAIDRWGVIYDSIGAPELRTGLAETGGGGQHVVYAQGPRRIRNTSGKLGAGIDTRGDGGYIVLAPSIHPSGKAYAWVEEPFYGIDPLPDDLIDLIQNTPLPPAAEATPATVNVNGERTLQRAYERIANATEGTRNEIINKAAWYLYGLVREGKLGETDVISVVELAAQRCGYPHRETLAVLRSVAGKR